MTFEEKKPEEQGIEPLEFKFREDTQETSPNGKVVINKTRISFDTEDIIAVFAGIIALIFAFGMLFGKIPVNALTIGVLGFSGIGAVSAEIIQARKKKKSNRKDG